MHKKLATAIKDHMKLHFFFCPKNKTSGKLSNHQLADYFLTAPLQCQITLAKYDNLTLCTS